MGDELKWQTGDEFIDLSRDQPIKITEGEKVFHCTETVVQTDSETSLYITMMEYAELQKRVYAT